MTPVIGHTRPSIFDRLRSLFRGPGYHRPRGAARHDAPGRLFYGPLGRQIVNYAPPSLGYGTRQASRELQSSAPQVASGDAHLLYDLDDLVAESQRLARNNTIYRALLKRLVDLIVGSGWRVQARTADDGLNARIEAAYKLRAKRMEIRGLDNALQFQRKTMWHALVDGRIGFIKDEQSGQLQAISGERIWSLTRYAEQPAGTPNMIAHGVELDALGRPVRFYIADWDAWGMNRRAAQTVDAANVIYAAPRERFDETAGAPPLQAVFPHLHRLNDIFDSEAAAWQILSRLALKVIKKDAARFAYGQSTDQSSGSTPKNIAERTSDMPWGLVFWGEEGEDIGGVERNLPNANFEQSIKTFLRICGMELGLSLPFFLLDWSEVNFSSGRAAAYQFWRNAAVWVDTLEQVLADDYRWWVRREAAAGRLPARADLEAHEWIGDPFQPLDADKENDADSGAVKASFKTVTRVLRERGTDRDEYFHERMAELSEAALLVAAHNAGHPDQPVTIAQFLGEQPTVGDGGAGDNAVGAEGTVVNKGAIVALNGAQIMAAVDVVNKLKQEQLSPVAALQLLIAVGVPSASARAIVDSTTVGKDATDDINFKREVVKQLIAGGTIGTVQDVVADGRALLSEVNVPVRHDADVEADGTDQSAGKAVKSEVT